MTYYTKRMLLILAAMVFVTLAAKWYASAGGSFSLPAWTPPSWLSDFGPVGGPLIIIALAIAMIMIFLRGILPLLGDLAPLLVIFGVLALYAMAINPKYAWVVTMVATIVTTYTFWIIVTIAIVTIICVLTEDTFLLKPMLVIALVIWGSVLLGPSALSWGKRALMNDAHRWEVRWFGERQ